MTSLPGLSVSGEVDGSGSLPTGDRLVRRNREQRRRRPGILLLSEKTHERLQRLVAFQDLELSLLLQRDASVVDRTARRALWASTEVSRSSTLDYAPVLAWLQLWGSRREATLRFRWRQCSARSPRVRRHNGVHSNGERRKLGVAKWTAGTVNCRHISQLSIVDQWAFSAAAR